MQTINLDPDKALIYFRQARRLAVIQAVDKLTKPLIMAWKDDRSHLAAPGIPGASKDRWRDYGSSHDGRLEINIGDEYHFIFSEADEYESPDLNVVTLTEQDGTPFSARAVPARKGNASYSATFPAVAPVDERCELRVSCGSPGPDRATGRGCELRPAGKSMNTMFD